MQFFLKLPSGSSSSQRTACLPHEPFVRLELQGDRRSSLSRADVFHVGLHGLAVDDLVDPARGAVNAVVVVAFADVAPVGDIHAAVGTCDQVDAAKPGSEVFMKSAA